jgi:tol-pal system protein YbgF
MNRYALRTKVFVFLGLIFLSGCAMQQDVVTLDDRLAAIEQFNSDNARKIDEQKKMRAQNEQDFRERYAGQNVLIEALRDEIQILNGRLEETEYLLKQQTNSYKNSSDKRAYQLDRIEQLVNSNKDRIKRVEQYLDFEITEPDLKAKKDLEVISDGPPVKKITENEIYISAKQVFDKGDFEAAREKFQGLIKQYPKTKYADNAQFWIGETYYREKWYEKAILEYQKVVENYPKGNKIQAALLKQGLAFFNLGDKANARLILTELVKKFPKTNEAKIAKQKLKEL